MVGNNVKNMSEKRNKKQSGILEAFARMEKKRKQPECPEIVQVGTI